MAENKSVAYVPYGNTKEIKELIEQKINSIPPYPDKAVKYAGYYKLPITNNDYQLKPQERFSYVLTRPAFVGIENHSIGVPLEGKTLFVSSIQLHTSISAVDANSYVELRDTTEVKYRYSLIRSESQQITFNPPLEFKKPSTSSTPSGFVIELSSGAATLNVTSVNIQGFIE